MAALAHATNPTAVVAPVAAVTPPIADGAARAASAVWTYLSHRGLKRASVQVRTKSAEELLTHFLSSAAVNEALDARLANVLRASLTLRPIADAPQHGPDTIAMVGALWLRVNRAETVHNQLIDVSAQVLAAAGADNSAEVTGAQLVPYLQHLRHLEWIEAYVT